MTQMLLQELELRPDGMERPLEIVRIEDWSIQTVKPLPGAGGEVAALQALGDSQAGIEAERKEAADSRTQIEHLVREREVLAQFEKSAPQVRAPQVLADRLALAAAEIAHSPSLYFVYHAGVHSAILQAHSGFQADAAPAVLSFPITDALLQTIQENDRRSEWTRLEAYEPLVRTIAAQTGVGRFEAWAVTGYGPLGRQARIPRLLGVLVLLGGVAAEKDPAPRSELLKNLMRTTGLVYEKTRLPLF
jgi:hypothetical protein